MAFDPSKFGAVPVQSFDASKFGATPSLTVNKPSTATTIWQTASPLSTGSAGQSVGGDLKTNLKELPNTLLSLANKITSGVGEDIAATSPDVQRNIDQMNSQKLANLKAAVVARNHLKSIGKDTSSADKQIASLLGESGMDPAEFLPALNKTNEQVAGDFAQLGTTILSAGAAPGLSADITGAETIGKGIIRGAKIGAAGGAAAGGASGIASGLQEDGSPTDVLAKGAVGAIGGGIFGGLFGGTVGGLTAKRVPAAQKQLENALEITSPTLNKQESISSMESAGASGGTKEPGLFGAKTKALPTKGDIKTAMSVADVVSPNKSPEGNIIAVNKKIASAANDLGEHFAANPVPANFEDFRDSMKLVQPSSSLKQEGSAETYNRVKENLIDTVYKHLKDVAKESGDFGSETNMAEFWDARKAVDSQIDAELSSTAGNSILETPQYIGAKAAAQDFRDGFNRFIANNIANPGEMEKVNVMHDVLAGARAKGIDIPTDADAMNILRKSLGIETTQELADARAAIYQDALDNMSSMYKARRNIAEANYRLAGKGVFERFLKNHPIVKKTGAALLTGLGLGTAADLGFKAVE